MPYIKANGIKIYYETYGEGQPLVMVAGYSVNTLALQSIAEILSTHFNVVLFDNRGVGATDVSDQLYSVELMADDTVALIEELELKKPHIFGNSLGGAVVQTVARNYSSKVAKVVIGNSTNKFNNQMKFATGYFLERFEKNHDVLEQAKLWLPLVFSSKFIGDAAKVDLFLTASINNPKPASVKGLKNQYVALANFDSTKWLGEIKNECLVVAGDEDLTCLQKESEVLHKLLPHSVLHVFPNCGHLPHTEYPQEFSRVITEFLRA